MTDSGRYVKLDKDNNPGGARWCTQHERLECTKHKRYQQGDCHAAALRGLDACKRHAGKRTDLALAEGEARITAWSAVGQARAPISTGMAVLGMLQMSWLRAAAYGELLRRQVAAQGTEAGNIEGDDSPEASGLIGFKYGAAGRDGTVYVQSEEVRALVALEAAERDRVVKYAETAHKMGISERLTSMAEMWGDLVAMRITGMLEQLQLSPEQMVKVPALLEAHLGSIDLGTMTGTIDDTGL